MERARPLWVYVAGAVLVAVLGTALVVVLYDRGVIPVAGPFVLIALLPLLGLLRVAYLARRTSRRNGELTALLGNLERLAVAERGTAYEQRATRASDGSLAEATALVRTAQAHLQARDSRSVSTVGELVQVTRAWRPEAPLTHQVHRTLLAAQKLNATWAEVNDLRASS